jgi:hypothetical protein
MRGERARPRVGGVSGRSIALRGGSALRPALLPSEGIVALPRKPGLRRSRCCGVSLSSPRRRCGAATCRMVSGHSQGSSAPIAAASLRDDEAEGAKVEVLDGRRSRKRACSLKRGRGPRLNVFASCNGRHQVRCGPAFSGNACLSIRLIRRIRDGRGSRWRVRGERRGPLPCALPRLPFARGGGAARPS